MRRTSHPRLSRALALVGLCALGGCTDDPYNPVPGPGELGNGEFNYVCLTDDDPACPVGPGVGNFPARFALGGRFGLQYDWDDAGKPPADLRSAAPARLKLAGEVFTALADGYTGVLALRSDGSVGDLIHVLVSTPTRVAVQVDRIDYAEYNAVAGQEIRFHAVARDDDAYDLAGALEFTWQVDDPAVAELIGTKGAHAFVRMLAPGTTTLRASLGDLTQEATLLVEQGAFTTGATDGTATDGTATDGTSTGDGSTGSTGSTGDGSSGGDSTGTTGGVL